MIISIIALLLLLAVTATLVKLNWSEKLYSPLLSLTLAGTVTTFITVLLMLKGSDSETSFSTLVVLDSTDYLVPFSHYPDTPFGETMNRHMFLTHPEFTVDEYKIKAFDSPKNDSEATLFNEELIQYSILMSIIDMQGERTMISTNNNGVSGKILKPFNLLDIEEKSVKDLKHELDKNRFQKLRQKVLLLNIVNLSSRRTLQLSFKEFPLRLKLDQKNKLLL